MGAVSTVRVIIAGDASGAKKAFGEVRKEQESTGKSFGSYAKSVGVGAGVVIAAAVGVGTVVVDWANKQEDSQARLSAALKAHGSSWNASSAAVLKAAKANEHYGFTAAQTEDAITQGVTSTGSLTKTLGFLPVALDLAAYKHISLQAAMLLVVKASQGQTKGLKQLGIDLPVTAGSAAKTAAAFVKVGTDEANLTKVMKLHATSAKDLVRIHKLQSDALIKLQKDQHALSVEQSKGTQNVKALAAAVKGQGAAAAGTMSGQIAALKAKMEDWGASIGKKIIPILLELAEWVNKTVIPAVQEMVTWAEKEWPKVEAAVVPVLIKLQGYITGFVNVVTVLWHDFGQRILTFVKTDFEAMWKTIQGIFNVIMGVVHLFTDLFTGKWGKLWGDVKQILHGALQIIEGFLQDAWNRIMLVLSIVWTMIGSAVKSGFGKVISFIEGVPGDILKLNVWFLKAGAGLVGALIGAILKEIPKIPGQILTALGDLSGLLIGAGSALMKGLIHGISTMAGAVVGAVKGVVNSIPVIGGIAKGLGFASGGMVPGPLGHPQLATVHGGETVMTPAQMQRMLQSTGGNGGSGGNQINHFPAGVDPSAVIRAQQKWNRRNGATG